MTPARILCLSLSLGGLVLPVAAIAQQGGSDEILVTARRDVEVLREVPASISVLTDDALARTGVSKMADVTELTPGVTIITGGVEVGDTQVNIRGINGARDAESNVALVVDGILKTNTAQLNQIQGDLTQVEVLKGPQGAYYGRNAAAGAVVMTTRKPGNEVRGNARLSYAGQYDSINGEASISGPVTNTLGMAMFGEYRETDGFYTNTGPTPGSQGNNVDSLRGWNIGLRGVYTPTDAVEIDVKLRYGEVDASALGFNTTFNLPTFALGNPDFDEDVNDHSFVFIGNIKPENNQETTELSAKLTYDLSFATFTGWYLYSDVVQDWFADSTSASLYRFELQPSCTDTRTSLANAGYLLPSPQVLLAAPFESVFGPFGPTTCDGTQYQVRDQEDHSVELRLASNPGGTLDWSVGVYYLNIDRHNGVAISEDQGFGVIPNLYNPPGTTNPTSLLFDDRFKTDVYAIFGSVEYDLNEQVTLSAALRYDREERDVTSLVPNVLDPATGDPINPGLPVSGTIPPKSDSYDEFQPKLSVTYKPSDLWTVFANWGIGFKAGGFNNQGTEALIDANFNVPLGANLLIQDDYRKEVSSAFELGTKALLFDGRLGLDLVLYHTDVDDMQFFEFFTGSFGLLRTVSNIDDVQIEGIEANATLRVVDGVTVFAGLNVTDSKIEKNVSRPDTVGNESPSTADYTVNLGLQALLPVTGTLDGFFRADWRLTGPTWFHTVQSQDVLTIFDLFFPGAGTANYTKTERDSFHILNVRAGVESEQWSVSLFANNALDEDWVSEVITAPEFGGTFIAPGSQREVGIEVGYRF